VIIALVTHVKQGNIEKKPLVPFILFGLIGAAVGSIAATRINSSMLRTIFGYFLLAMGVYEFFRKPEGSEKHVRNN
ncbi:MAG: sulfite exporter TauE/SafE family protein, partial [Clostridiales bacterium]|nr:sulfite exporter TauE/SafE family protein [Clostridiales bacterium]